MLTRCADYYINPVLKSNIYSSILDIDPKQAWAVPQYSCVFRNCTWNATTTLTVSYACTDLSSQVKHVFRYGSEGDTHWVGLDNGPWLYWFEAGGGGTPMHITTGSNLTSWDHLGPIYGLNYVYYVLALGSETMAGAESTSQDDKTKYCATECVLYPCARRITGNVANSNYSETLEEMYDDASGTTTQSWCTNVPDMYYPVLIQPPPSPSPPASQLV